MPRIAKRQIVKSVILVTLGALLGLIPMRLQTPEPGFAIFIAVLGMLVGFALSLPGVSAARVVGGVAGMVIAKNVPIGGHAILKALTSDGTTPVDPECVELPIDPDVKFPDGSRHEITRHGYNLNWECFCGQTLKLGWLPVIRKIEEDPSLASVLVDTNCRVCSRQYRLVKSGETYTLQEA